MNRPKPDFKSASVDFLSGLDSSRLTNFCLKSGTIATHEEGAMNLFLGINWAELFSLSVPISEMIVRGTAIYWFLSYEPAGTAMLFIFGIAMGVMSWVLIPTFGDVVPTAPVDAEWRERRS